MNKAFDHDRGGRTQWVAWLAEIMREVYRVMKPGAHGLVWSLPRTSHWTATALEDAGFEIRDSIYHLYSRNDKLQQFIGTLSDEQEKMFLQVMEEEPVMLSVTGQGFPKSQNISAAIDKYYEVEREVVGYQNAMGNARGKGAAGHYANNIPSMVGQGYEVIKDGWNITAPATPEAILHQGKGTALKPSVECWWLIRKPISEPTIARNVLKWSTGGLNIDKSRIAGSEWNRPPRTPNTIYGNGNGTNITESASNSLGRFPSHLLMSHSLFCTDTLCDDCCPTRALDEQSGVSRGVRNMRGNHSDIRGNNYNRSNGATIPDTDSLRGYNDQGGASRFFKTFPPFIYCPKASRRDRSSNGTVENIHPTTKSTELMKYLISLVTPHNGIVLDPFCGSGSTLVAAIHEHYHYIGIEQDESYYEIACARVAHAQRDEH